MSSFDLGTTITGVVEARTQLAGTFTPGIGHLPGEDPFQINASLFAILDYPQSPPLPGDYLWQVEKSLRNAIPFSFDKKFEWITMRGIIGSNPNWDFLLDGTGDIRVFLGFIVFGGMIIDQEPSFTLSSASLSVDAVPEPATVLLLCLGAVIVRKH